MQDQHAIRFQVIARMQAQGIAKDEILTEIPGLKKRTLYLILSGRQKVSLVLLKELAQFFSRQKGSDKVSIEDLMAPIPSQFGA